MIEVVFSSSFCFLEDNANDSNSLASFSSL